MVKFLIPVLLASTVAAAAPAAAQWAPPVPQGYAYGYNNHSNQGLARAYSQRINRLHRQIHRLGERGQLSRSEFLRLNRAVDVLENRLARSSYRGLSRQEAYAIERDIARLERAIYREARDGRGYRDHHSRPQYGYNDYRYDRDRDGRDDRFEDDRGHDRDD